MSENSIPKDNPLKGNQYGGPSQRPGRGAAIGSFVCGLIAVILEIIGFWVIIVMPIIGIVLSIVAIVLAGSAARAGYMEGMRTAGLVFGILGLIFGILMLINGIACAGCACLL